MSLRNPKRFLDNLNLEERCRLLSLELFFVLLINSRMSLGSSITFRSLGLVKALISSKVEKKSQHIPEF